MYIWRILKYMVCWFLAVVKWRKEQYDVLMIIMKYDDGKGGQEEVLKGLMEPLLIAILCTLHLKHNVQSHHETAATSFSNPLPVSSRLQRAGSSTWISTFSITVSPRRTWNYRL